MNQTELLTYGSLGEKSNPFMRPLLTKASVRYASVKSSDGMMLKEVSLNGKAGDRLLNTILHGDTKEELLKYPDNFIDLIVTSPPYADSRKKTYGGIHADRYVEWFLPFTKEFFRVLKPTGSFILNIKEKVVDGERHTYVLDLILQMRKQGWLWTDEYVWHKKNCYPGKWPNRFRDAWERCLHFTKTRNFAMHQEAVMVPMGNWRESRLRNLSETDRTRDESRVSSGFGKKIENWIGRDMAFPTNVLHLATECANKSHSATFPEALPTWFIKLFTKENDIVLDPFLGSGTTAVASAKLLRNFIGIEINAGYCALAREHLAEIGPIQAELAVLKNGH